MSKKKNTYDGHTDLGALENTYIQVQQLISAGQITASIAVSEVLIERIFVGYDCRSHVHILENLDRQWRELIDSGSLRVDDKEKLYQYIFKNLHENMLLYNSDIYFFLQPICAKLAAQLGKIDAFISYTLELVKYCADIYGEDHMLECFCLLYEAGRADEAMALLQHTEAGTERFRVKAATSLLEKYKDLTRARELIVPNYEISFSDRPLNVFSSSFNWQGLAVMLFYAEGDKLALKNSLIRVLLQKGALQFEEYLKELHRLCSVDEWQILYPQLEEKAIKKSTMEGWERFPEDQADLYAISNDDEKLLNLLQTHEDPYFSKYIKYVLPKYKTEVTEVLYKYVETRINNTSSHFVLESELSEIIPQIPSAIDRLNTLFYSVGKNLVLKDDRVIFEAVGR